MSKVWHLILNIYKLLLKTVVESDFFNQSPGWKKSYMQEILEQNGAYPYSVH